MESSADLDVTGNEQDTSQDSRTFIERMMENCRRDRVKFARVARFFAVYSRFEFALKRAGYIYQDNGLAQADIKQFARDLQTMYMQNLTALCDQADFFAGKPPEKQTADPIGRERGPRQYELKWESRYKDNHRFDPDSLYDILDSVRQVRHNLFHGGKQPYKPVDEPSRDMSLLDHSMKVIETCIRWSDEKKNHPKLPKVAEYFVSKLE